MKPLSYKFYKRDTFLVARELLGKSLFHLYKGVQIGGIITETEAYLGAGDRACHSYGGRRTNRIESMYLSGGHAYVYLIYGLHHCINVVTKTETEAEAVLIRAIYPTSGIEKMKTRRKLKSPTLTNLCSGPGKLCQALGIDRSLDGESFHGPNLFITNGIEFSKIQKTISATERIGIENSGEARDWLLRFSFDITN